jgi:hypothetical protein
MIEWFKGFAASVGMVGCALILIVGVTFAGGALYIVYLNTLGVATMNAEREVVVHSRQYIQTHRQVLVNLYADWTIATDEAHKNGARLQICAESAMLTPSEWPQQVAPFIAQNCQ